MGKEIEEELNEECEDQLEEAEEKQETKKVKSVSDPFADTIKSYLDTYSASDEIFANNYAKEGKNIEDCCNYICDCVQKMKVKGLSDDEVYHLAREYYELDNLEVAKGWQTVVVNHKVELTAEEKREAKEQAIAKFRQKELEKIEAKQKKEFEVQNKAIEKEKAKNEESGQVSIFDLLGA